MGTREAEKNYVVLGFGNIGRNIVYDLVENNKDGLEISVYDPFIRPSPSEFPGVNFHSSDPFANNTADEVFDPGNVVISALPPSLMQKAYDFTVKFGGNLVDTASVHTNIDGLLDSQGNFLIIPEFGIAPGITNFLVGHFISHMEEIENVKIYVGGIPNKPIPPMEYKITWSLPALINMYLNPVEIYENGSLKVVEPLAGLEEFKIDGFDYPLEAFYTDGLSTLKYTLKNAKNMFEKTIRYSGHAAKISLLKSLGYFDNKEIMVSNRGVKPRDLTEALFNERLKAKGVGDTLLLRVHVDGKEQQRHVDKEATLVYSMLPNNPFTAMSHTTGFPPSIIAQMICTGEVTGLKGYIPPQVIGRDQRIFERVIGGLIGRGVKITMREG